MFHRKKRYARKGSKKPRVPIEKLKTGGTAPTLNSDDACSIVPSPPNVMTKSISCDSMEKSMFVGLLTIRMGYSALGVQTSMSRWIFLPSSWNTRTSGYFDLMCLHVNVSRYNATTTQKTHFKKESIVSRTGFVRSLLTMRIDFTGAFRAEFSNVAT